MKTLCVVDGNNWFRRKAETDIFGNPLRSCFYHLQSMDFDEVILVWDGRGSLAARRKIYPEYKVHRQAPNESLFEFQNEFKQLAQLSKARSIEVAGYEGDDVIATIVRHYQAQGVKVFIESNDADFAQLGCEMARKEFKIPARWVPLYKATVGDHSDNIKGIGGFGDGAWTKLTDENRKTLEIYIKNIEGHASAIGELNIAEFMAKRHLTWLDDEKNRQLLAAYWNIVHFIPMDYKTLEFTPGLNRVDLAEQVLLSYLS